MDLKKKIMNAVSTQFNSAGLSDPESMKTMGDYKSEIKNKMVNTDNIINTETKEATASGSAGGFVPALSGEMEEKWSEKYKKSIDCNNPRGFSQRAHCQGRKKKLKESINEAVRTELAQLKDLARKFAKEKSEKQAEKDKIEKMFVTLQRQLKKGMKVEMEHEMGLKKAKEIALDHLKENPYYYDDLEKVENPKKTETKEATSTSSSGQYSGPAFGAKSMSPKHWRGRSKTQIPGGAFVQVKKKCKTFPYCNQGDINAVELTRNPIVKKKAKKLSEQYGVSEELIIKLVLEDIYKKTNSK
jgi:hypothetical protein